MQSISAALICACSARSANSVASLETQGKSEDSGVFPESSLFCLYISPAVIMWGATLSRQHGSIRSKSWESGRRGADGDIWRVMLQKTHVKPHMLLQDVCQRHRIGYNDCFTNKMLVARKEFKMRRGKRGIGIRFGSFIQPEYSSLEEQSGLNPPPPFFFIEEQQQQQP